MTKSINHPPNPEPEKENSVKRLVSKLKSSPKTVVIGVVAIAGVGSLGYWGIQVLVKQKLPGLLENQIGNIIERPINLGTVKSFSLNSIIFERVLIPPTNADLDQVTVQEVEVGFNILPIFFRRTLPLDVTLVQPDIYLAQKQNGEWVNLDFLQSDPNKEKKDPLIYFDVDLDVEQADITAVPYEENALTVQLDGSGRFDQKKSFLDYDLDAAIEQAKANIKGETKLETGTTDTKLLVEDLALSDVTTLLPTTPVELDSGRLNADLDINIPSFEEITAANIKGMVNLQNVAGEVADLNTAVTAKSKLDFDGRNVDVNQTQAAMGDIIAQVDGKVNLDTGYDLNVNVLPFQLASIPNGLIEQLPIAMAGEVAAQVELRGAIKDPQLMGRINNTQTVTIDKTPLEQINAEFSANLAQIVLENVEIIPVAGGSVTAQGKVTTNLQQALSNEQQSIDATTMPLAFTFQADLPTQTLISPYYQLPEQVAVGNLEAEGEIDGTVDNPKAIVNWNIAETQADNLEDLAGSGELIFANNNLSLQDTEITYGDGAAEVEAEADLENKQWQASLDANSLNLTPFLSQFNSPNLNLNQPVAVNTAQAQFNGRLDQLDLEKIQGTADLNLDVNGGDVVVDGQLNSGNLEAQVNTSNIPLDPFITSLPVAASLQSGTINANGKLEQLLAWQKNPSLSSLNADADLNLNLDGEAVQVNSQINSGRFQANANTNQIDLNRVVPNLPVPAQVRSSQVTASGELQQLLTFADNPNLSTVEARVEANLGVAEGTARAIANLNNNQWSANLNATDVSSQVLLEQFAPNNLASVEVDNINAQANLTGDINPLLNNEVNIPVAVNRFNVNSGAQNVNAQGNFTLSNITSNLDIASTNLDLDANLDFDRLPVDQVMASATQNNQLIAENLDLRGQAAFNGQLNAQQLLSQPTENLNLTGDLRLVDFAFNDVEFDPVMSGSLNVQPQQEIALNLQGEQDIIAARAVPCTASDCKLPYLPTNLELRQGEDTAQPVIATGDRTGDLFALDINNFPLALLNLAPAQTAGIEGALKGKTTGEVDLNLATLAAQGNIQIEQPGVGYIEAEQLNANFNYDPAANIAEVTQSSLALGESEYNLNAALDLQSGEIEGKLNIPEAYIQDILTALRWFTVEDVISLFNIPDYGEPAAVKPAPEEDTVDQSIARKLNKLRQVNAQIQSNAAQQEASNIPSELDIEGRYEGEIVLGGTIQTPQADFKVEGEDWQWQPTEAYPDIVPPLGLVIEEPQFIEIPQVLVDGKLEGTTVALETASIQVQQALLSLKGELSPEQTDAEFTIANLTVDNIGNFVEIPVDVTGEINSTGTIKGTPSQPQLAGEVSFSKGAFNGNILPARLAGDFDYNGRQLAFKTTVPESIEVAASVPYPIIPGKSDRFYAKANIEKEAFVFLSAFSQNYLNWMEGEGNAQLEANARLDLEREGVIYDLDAQGVVNLEDAEIEVETPFFKEPFIGTGKITLNNQIVNVETLNGSFADKALSVTGKLPILTAVNNLDNPLTIDLPPGDINIDKLYEGGVEGKVQVTGASRQPVIGGKVILEDGRVSIPQSDQPSTEETITVVKNKVSNASNTIAATKATSVPAADSAKSSTAESSFITTLNDLQVELKDFNFEQAPVYEFQLNGDLTLNGTADQPSNIIPQGTLTLARADVNLFSTKFDLARTRENTIVFTPEAGVFNPALDIILRTEVEEIDNQQFNNLRTVEANSNEINDPISQGSSGDTVRVSLVIDGETTAILPNLNQQTDSSCNVRPSSEPLVESEKYYTAAELNRFTDCFNDGSSIGSGDRSLVNSPAVELTSTPSLDQGEILNLLSGQFVAFADQVTNSSQSELFDLGVERFVIDPALDSVLFRVEDATVSLGEKINLDYLTVYPDLEAIYEMSPDSSIRFTFAHNLFNGIAEAINNSDDEEVDSAQEVRVEYQLNF